MVEQQNSPFARVSNGYDPRQVAAFAAEALSWKKELVTLRAEVAAAGKLVERYESVIGNIEDVEREAMQLVEEAESKAAGLIENAEVQAAKLVEEAESQAATLIEDAEVRASEMLASAENAAAPSHDTARDRVEGGIRTETLDEPVNESTGWLNPEPAPQEIPDPVEEIFEPIDEVEVVDAEDDRQRRAAAAAANLWKRRGVLSPSE